MKLSLLFVATLVAVFKQECNGHQIEFFNRCPHSILVGTLDVKIPVQVANGGFKLESNERKTYDFPLNWQGTTWGRTGCSPSGQCETGNCFGGVECAGSGPQHPMTQAEFNFELKPDAGNKVYYDVSLVNGFNLPVTITPRAEDFEPSGPGPYDCKPADCLGSFDRCPEKLKKKVQGERVVGCESACDYFNEDKYCCRGAYDKPNTCLRSNWEKDYPADYKAMCPRAYTFAYDDDKSTFTCKPKIPAMSRFTVQFC